MRAKFTTIKPDTAPDTSGRALLSSARTLREEYMESPE
jgi:hypothetical protein